jgi:hypothetical protein
VRKGVGEEVVIKQRRQAQQGSGLGAPLCSVPFGVT